MIRDYICLLYTSEIIETLSALKPWETSGMVVVQAESEVASINMVYGLSLIHIS